MRRLLVLVGVLSVLAAALGARTAAASQLIDRDGTNVHIRADAQGRALISYDKGGRHRNVLVWGAINAVPPKSGGHQVQFHLDYSGNAAAGFKGRCGAYDGPSLPFVVAACKAPDGSYWAVQEWPEALPDLGFAPWTSAQRARWMNVSHWRGGVAKLEAYPDWVYSGTFHSLFGRYTYDGAPVHGFGTTSVGVPTDGFGRLIFLDTYGSTYGAGWMRENSFVSHNPTGVFCYGFYSFDPTKGGYIHPPGATAKRGPGVGSQYRLIAVGPGVTPDVQTLITDLGDFDASSADDLALRLKQWRLFSTFIGSDKQCRLGRALGAVNVEVQKSWFSTTPGGPEVSSASLGSPFYFNVSFAKPAAAGGPLPQAWVTWVHTSSNGVSRIKTQNVTLSSDGLVASALFALKGANNRRYVGDWSAALTMNGLQLASAKVQTSLAPGTLANLTQPVLNGSLSVGSTLSVTTGTWSFVPTRIDIQWIKCPATGGNCVNLGSGTSYTLTPADVGWRIMVDVWAYAPNRSQPIGAGAFARDPVK